MHLRLVFSVFMLVACAQPVDPTGSGGTGASDGGGPATGAAGPGGSNPGGAGGGTGGSGGAGGASSCSDASLNGDETDVDCGGSCPPCAAGGACESEVDCASGFCATDDGVCCSTACDGSCEACSEPKTGLADGTCGPVLLGSDPETECAATPAQGCGPAGLGCDGAGECVLHAAGVACGAASCVGGVATAGSTCDGAGTCVAGATTDCGAYACDPVAQACKSSCTSNADCEAPATCAGGVCGGVVIDTLNLGGLTEYPLDTDTCQCCGGTTTAETATALCVLAGYTNALTWTTGTINGTNCYCWDCIAPNAWASNCCSGLTDRPMILSVTCE